MQHHVSDAHGNWLLFGSSTGHCVLWDVRYGFELHCWQLPGAPKIRSMLHVRPNNTPRPIVFMGVDENVISGWEVSETPRCALLLQSAETSDAAATLAAGPPSPPMTTLKAAVSNGTHAARTLLGPLDGSCVLSGGSDMRLRCWRLRRDIVRWERGREGGTAVDGIGDDLSRRWCVQSWRRRQLLLRDDQSAYWRCTVGLGSCL